MDGLMGCGSRLRISPLILILLVAPSLGHCQQQQHHRRPESVTEGATTHMLHHVFGLQDKNRTLKPQQDLHKHSLDTQRSSSLSRDNKRIVKSDVKQETYIKNEEDKNTKEFKVNSRPEGRQRHEDPRQTPVDRRQRPQVPRQRLENPRQGSEDLHSSPDLRQRPIDPQQNPQVHRQRPENPRQRTQVPRQRPENHRHSPEDPRKAPENLRKRPENLHRFEDPRQEPDNRRQRPENHQQGAQVRRQRPKNLHSSDDPRQRPDDPRQRHDNSRQRPDDPRQRPDDPRNTPTDPRHTPIDSRQTPENRRHTSTDPRQRPEVPRVPQLPEHLPPGLASRLNEFPSVGSSPDGSPPHAFFQPRIQVESEEVGDAEWEQLLVEGWSKDGVVPSLLHGPPPYLINVNYGDHQCVHLGNTITPAHARIPPNSLRFPGEEGRLYTVILLDMDDPLPRLQWVLINVPSANPRQGVEVVEYEGPRPALDTGHHRLVFLVYLQRGGALRSSDRKVPRARSCQSEGRDLIDLRHLVDDLELDGPTAGNYFISEWDVTVEHTCTLPPPPPPPATPAAVS